MSNEIEIATNSPINTTPMDKDEVNKDNTHDSLDRKVDRRVYLRRGSPLIVFESVFYVPMLGASTASPGSKVSFLEKRDNALWVIVSREGQHVIEPWIEDTAKGKGYRALKRENAVNLTRSDTIDQKPAKHAVNG